MGGVFTCCRQRQQLIDFIGLSSLDPQLIASIEQLRREHQLEIDQSYEMHIGSIIYRGGVDQNGRKTGYGELYRQQFVFLGDFSLDKPSGYGILIKGKEEYYRGQFAEGKYHGKGREFSQNHQFQGDYEHGWRRRGILRTSQYQYQGQFKENLFDGHGHLQFSNANSYDGLFESGKYHGRGFLTFSNSHKYEGGFQNGQYHGQGKFTWPDGVYAQCYFQKGVRKGRQIFRNRTIIKPNKVKENGKADELTEQNKKQWFDFGDIPQVVRGNELIPYIFYSSTNKHRILAASQRAVILKLSITVYKEAKQTSKYIWLYNYVQYIILLILCSQLLLTIKMKIRIQIG